MPMSGWGRMTMVPTTARRDAGPVLNPITAGVVMTAFVLEPQPFRRGPSPEAAAVVGVAAAVVVLALFAAGVTCFGLAIAPIAELVHVHIRAANPALAGFWPAFAALALASFAAAAITAARAVEFLTPRD